MFSLLILVVVLKFRIEGRKLAEYIGKEDVFRVVERPKPFAALTVGDDTQFTLGAENGSTGIAGLGVGGSDLGGRKRASGKEVDQENSGAIKGGQVWWGRIFRRGMKVEAGGGDGKVEGRREGTEVVLDGVKATGIGRGVGGVDGPDEARVLDGGSGSVDAVEGDLMFLTGVGITQVMGGENGQAAGLGQPAKMGNDFSGAGGVFRTDEAVQAVNDDEASDRVASGGEYCLAVTRAEQIKVGFGNEQRRK